jgi:phage terminase large subunit
MPEELYRQEYDCDFSAANVGSVFGRYIEQAEREGRIHATLDDDNDGCEIVISCDLGRRDKAAFWWWRVMKGGAELFDFTEGSGRDAEEWIDVLRDQYTRADVIVLPHDAKVKTFQSRHSVAEQFLKAEIAERIVVNAVRKKQDSINAGRTVLRKVRFDAERCDVGLDALRMYHFKYDEEQRCFSNEPEHDWSSHAADALMEGAAWIGELHEPEPAPRSSIRTGFDRQFNLDELHEANSWRHHGRMT